MSSIIPVLRPPLITLTTDFGLADAYVGVMKGVILSIAPEARLVDLCHLISPQSLIQAAVQLEASVDYFPPGAVHVIVVDPGVGTERGVLMVETNRALFVAPDNGVLTLALRRQQAVRWALADDGASGHMLPRLSATFHGRDVFAPLAAHLSVGVPMAKLGDVVEVDASRPPVDVGAAALALPQPRWLAGGELEIHALCADRFGNVITDLAREASGINGDGSSVTFLISGRAISGIHRTFADVLPEMPVAYWGSGGRLEIAIRNGSAAQELSLQPGDPILVSGFTS